MKVAFKLIAVIAMLVVSLVPGSTASAEADKYREAEAYFHHTEGCLYTTVIVLTGEEFLYSLSILQYDECQNQALLMAYGIKHLSKSEIQYLGNLKSVTLTATVPMVDIYNNLSFDGGINLTWTGTGDILVNGKEKYRESPASGTVSNGMINFTPQPATGAAIFLYK